MEYQSSTAYDLDNQDIDLAGNDWTVVPIHRVIWDFNHDTSGNSFIAPIDGLYNHDVQMTIKDCVNVDEVELALFKMVDGVEDYWFISDKKVPIGGVAHLNGSTQFDFYEGEEFYLKIKLHGENASAKINGSDDLTAWGFSYYSFIKGD